MLDSNQPGGEFEDLHPLVLSPKVNSEDNPRYHEAMSGPDAEGFREAMQIEYDQLQKRKAWIIVEKKEYNVLRSTWVYKVKLYPDGRVKKLNKLKVWTISKHMPQLSNGQQSEQCIYCLLL